MSFCYAKILLEVRASKRRVAAAASNGKSLGNTAASVQPPANSKDTTVLTRESSESSQQARGGFHLKVPTQGGDHFAAVKDKNRMEQKQKRRQEELRLTSSFLVVIFVFICSWMPFCITMFLSVFSSKPVKRLPDITTLLLGCANSCYNPVIYGLMNTKFRQGFRRLYCETLLKPCRRPRYAGGLNSRQHTLRIDESVMPVSAMVAGH